MPIYEYFCPHCQNKKEVVQRITDDPLSSCPDCHKSGLLKRPPSSVGLHFKGSGFYKTDYPSSSSCCTDCKGSCSHHTKS